MLTLQTRAGQSKSTQSEIMALHLNMMDRPPVKTPQSADVHQTHRRHASLSLPERYEICLPVGSAEEKPHRVAELHPDVLLEDTESEESSKSSDVSLKAQILILEEQKNELLSINKKWAKEYRTMAKYYKEKVQFLKELQEHNRSDEETSDEREKRVTFRKEMGQKTDMLTEEEDEVVNAEFLTAEREAKELRLQNSTLARRGQHQHEEIRRLNKALEEALLTSQSRGTSGETLHDLWKHQAEVYKEDFLKERRDREKLNERYLEMEKRFKKVQNELRALKSQVTWNQPVHCCSCTNQAEGPNWEVRPVNQQHIQKQRR